MSKGSQHAALQGYLDALLTDSTPEPSRVEAPEPAQPAPFLEPPVPAVTFTLPPVALAEPLISTEQISQLPTSVVATEQQSELTVEVPAATVKAAQPSISRWAEGPFECLLFDVAGLTLAVPLAALGTIYPYQADQLTPLFGQPDWFVGILPTAGANLKVLETARWVMPERYTADMRDGLKYVISINGYDWGLAVHQVRHSIHLQPEEVKWRTQRGKRAWLAGTVIEHMCALLDVEILAELITGQDAPPVVLK